jgi:hypothetical protein
MYINYWIALALATVTLARPTTTDGAVHVHVRDVLDTQDTASLRRALATITAAVTGFDESLKKITADNVATSIKDMNTKGHELADAFGSGAKAISGSSPLKGIQDVIGLLTPGRAIGYALNDTYQSYLAKADIIKNSKQIALVVDMLKAQKQPLVDFQKAFLAQLPASMTSAIPKEYILPDAMLLALLDIGIQQVADAMDGKAAGFTLPGAASAGGPPSGIPAGSLPIAGGIPAAPPSTSAPPKTVPTSATPKTSPRSV